MSAGSRGSYVTKGNMMKKAADLLERAEEAEGSVTSERLIQLAAMWIQLAQAYSAGR